MTDYLHQSDTAHTLANGGASVTAVSYFGSLATPAALIWNADPAGAGPETVTFSDTRVAPAQPAGETVHLFTIAIAADQRLLSVTLNGTPLETGLMPWIWGVSGGGPFMLTIDVTSLLTPGMGYTLVAEGHRDAGGGTPAYLHDLSFHFERPEGGRAYGGWEQ